MNNLYKEFIEKEVISEEKFLEIIEAIHYPLDNSISSIDFNDPLDEDSVAIDLIDEMLFEAYNYVYIDDLNFEERTFSIEDLDSLEDLEEIKEYFSGWTISNYEELKESLLAEKEKDKETKEYYEKRDLLLKLIDKISIKEIKELIKNYDQR